MKVGCSGFVRSRWRDQVRHQQAQLPRRGHQEPDAGRAKQIYLRDFSLKASCDAVPAGIRFDLFDMAVNLASKAAIRTLQRTVGRAPDGVPGR